MYSTRAKRHFLVKIFKKTKKRKNQIRFYSRQVGAPPRVSCSYSIVPPAPEPPARTMAPKKKAGPKKPRPPPAAKKPAGNTVRALLSTVGVDDPEVALAGCESLEAQVETQTPNPKP